MTTTNHSTSTPNSAEVPSTESTRTKILVTVLGALVFVALFLTTLLTTDEGVGLKPLNIIGNGALAVGGVLAALHRIGKYEKPAMNDIGLFLVGVGGVQMMAVALMAP